GRDRFRLIEVTEGRSFLTGDVEPVDDDVDPPEDVDVDRAVRAFRKLVEVAEADVDEPVGEEGPLSFELASRVDFGLELKQELLELRSERARLKRLTERNERAGDADR